MIASALVFSTCALYLHARYIDHFDHFRLWKVLAIAVSFQICFLVAASAVGAFKFDNYDKIVIILSIFLTFGVTIYIVADLCLITIEHVDSNDHVLAVLMIYGHITFIIALVIVVFIALSDNLRNNRAQKSKKAESKNSEQ